VYGKQQSGKIQALKKTAAGWKKLMWQLFASNVAATGLINDKAVAISDH